ncbi:chemotaxis protein CheA [Pseudoroseicyclus aestuarii]|uniref:Chemotaxis protein CheA n=1 Tax=Pseudoroseicyclus aestuarii TaxID=1795041 RepID=A0A318SUC4_9RHOB|nr:chemotaxis protein CheA [Pseudoroseicyclus aestuarii]PYE84965.1 two-component system chemotaxis sensor kinase CheA [Pseudoroseicyclus aestuarii]
MSTIRDTFFDECEDLLEAMAEGLAAMSDGTADGETVNAVFRAVHSIKGGAGAFKLELLVSFAHTFETVLDQVRSGFLTAEGELMKVLERSGDMLGDLVASARDEEEADEAAVAAACETLEAFLGEVEDEEEETDFVFSAVTIDLDDAPEAPKEGSFRILFAPKADLYANGHEPLALLRALKEMGEIEVTAGWDALPDPAGPDWDQPALTWTVQLTTTADADEIASVFEFVEGLCDLQIEADSDAPEASAAQPEEAAPGPVAAGSAPEAPPVESPAPPPSAPAPAATAESAKPDSKSSESKAPQAASGPRATLRVDLDRVDRLINTVGELIINQAMIAQRLKEADLPPNADLMGDLDDYKILARDIQEGVMAIRAQPVKPLFQRMSRIVREASDATGKEVRLVTEGENTEVDKTLIERLSDPLTHMIRNAIDHGIEKPQKRIEAGKDPVGTVRLAAFHRSGNVLIEIGDDGAGVNRPRVKQIAIDKNLIPADAELTETEIDNLLFRPGFSTAAEVTNLSGRGVGMDVVKTAINQLGGRISIASKPGEGSVFSCAMPLTLAVLDGMVVTVGTQTMVVPIASVLETIRPRPEEIHKVGVSGQVLSIRGTYVPIIDLAVSLGHDCGRDRHLRDLVLLLVQTEGHEQVALAVDHISDQRQVVIKSLQGNYGAIEGISAATILGDGKIALIIDTDAVAASAGPFRLSDARPTEELFE